MTTPINNIPSTPWHDEGAIARCSYCGRYTLDPTALGETHKQPMCECGQRHGWCGSFKKPGPDAQWSGVPAVTIYKPQNMGKSEQAANLMETVPPLDADEAMKRVWSEWHAYCKDRLRPSMADQMAFYEIAQPILRALAAAPAPHPVAVKPLEWEELFDEIIEAGTQFGYCYRIFPEPGRSDGKKLFVINCISGSFLSIEAAKAAAQADYEQRIRSALVSAPPTELDRLKAENERLKDLVEKLDGEVQP